MHACGHDGHTATLIAASIWLKQNEDKLPNPVALLFQPAEEGGHGAKKMIDEGCLVGIDMIYGWHNWPAIKFGQAVCPDGTVMAGNGTFHIKIVGKGGHSSQPELCSDPILAASAITLNLQQIISRKVSPQDSAVVSVTSINGKSDVTSIPHSVLLEGSIRVPNDELKKFVFEQIETITKSTADSYGVKVEIELRDRYGATINHNLQASIMREKLQKTLGENWKSDLPTPIMASEDFSYYLNDRL
jgi:hippurate hydrolase